MSRTYPQDTLPRWNEECEEFNPTMLENSKADLARYRSWLLCLQVSTTTNCVHFNVMQSLSSPRTCDITTLRNIASTFMPNLRRHNGFHAKSVPSLSSPRMSKKAAQAKSSSAHGSPQDTLTHGPFHTKTLLHTDIFTHRPFYRQILVYTDTFTDTHTHPLLHTNPFTPRPFYTQTLVHTDRLTHRPFYTETLLHTVHKDTSKHIPFYTQTLLHTNPFTQRCFHTQTLLHADAVTCDTKSLSTCKHRPFYTKTLLLTDTCARKDIYTQTLLH